MTSRSCSLGLIVVTGATLGMALAMASVRAWGQCWFTVLCAGVFLAAAWVCWIDADMQDDERAGRPRGERLRALAERWLASLERTARPPEA